LEKRRALEGPGPPPDGALAPLDGSQFENGVPAAPQSMSKAEIRQIARQRGLL